MRSLRTLPCRTSTHPSALVTPVPFTRHLLCAVSGAAIVTQPLSLLLVNRVGLSRSSVACSLLLHSASCRQNRYEATTYHRTSQPSSDTVLSFRALTSFLVQPLARSAVCSPYSRRQCYPVSHRSRSSADTCIRATGHSSGHARSNSRCSIATSVPCVTCIAIVIADLLDHPRALHPSAIFLSQVLSPCARIASHRVVVHGVWCCRTSVRTRSSRVCSRPASVCWPRSPLPASDTGRMSDSASGHPRRPWRVSETATQTSTADSLSFLHQLVLAGAALALLSSSCARGVLSRHQLSQRSCAISCRVHSNAEH